MDIVVYNTTDELSQAAAQVFIRAANEAISARGRFTLALSGGSTPKKLYALLAQEPYHNQIDWSRVFIFWSDERCVPPDDSESNYKLAYDALLSKVDIPTSQIYRMQGENRDHEAAAQQYEQDLQSTFQTNGVPVFDLIQLGMGPDGHTASLFPGKPALHENERLAVYVSGSPKPPPDRLSLTAPVLNAARHLLFLVTGADKAGTLKAVIEGPYQPELYPTQLVRSPQGQLTWMLDKAAAQHLHLPEQEG